MEPEEEEQPGDRLRFQVPEPGTPDELAQMRELLGHVERMLASLPTIEQAKGLLMAYEGCTADQAFDMLRGASQRLNTPLREVARSLVARHEQRQVLPRAQRARDVSARLVKEAAELMSQDRPSPKRPL